MALKKLAFKTDASQAKARLDQFLADQLPNALGQPVSKAKARKLIVAGAVYLNGRRVRIASKELIPGARVEVYVDLARMQSDGRSQDRAFQMSASHVLFEDEWLIVVNKPAGLPTQPTLDEARDNLFASVKSFLAERDRVAQPYLGLHHRLDRDTSGVVLFTKSQKANAGVAELFTGHLARKTYHALSVRPVRLPVQAVEQEWKVKNFLGRAPGTGKKARFTAVRSGGDPAETEFKLLELLPQGLYVEARPLTGRTHQIRVHLAEGGMPILGDPFYGAPERSAPRVMLHAVRLTFPHPIHKTEVSIESPLPGDFLQCLQTLRTKKAAGGAAE